MGLSAGERSDYRRSLSLDSAVAVVRFKKDDVHISATFFISYPANVMAVQCALAADCPGKQNLRSAMRPILVSEGEMRARRKQRTIFRRVG